MDSGKENEKIIYFFLHFLFPVHVSFPERKKGRKKRENKKENIFSTSFFCFFLYKKEDILLGFVSMRASVYFTSLYVRQASISARGNVKKPYVDGFK